MKVEVLEGPPGCGKSTELRREAVATKGRYLFAYPTERLIQEQAAEFRKAAGIEVIEAHYKSPGHGTVQTKLTEAANKVTGSRVSHAVVLTTHESLMGCELSAFQDWHIRIDEAPNAIQSGKVSTPVSAGFFKTNFALSPPVVSTGWSEVKLLSPAAAWRAIAKDDIAGKLGEFMKQAARPAGVYVDVDNWDTGKFQWCSMWTPDLLFHIAVSVKIAGASYRTSIGGLVAALRVEFVPRPILMPRTHKPTIRIHYFTEGHEGTSALWATSYGRGFIVKICDHLVTNEPQLGFWSANVEVQNLMEHRVSGGPIPPKVAGLNSFMDRTSCAIIYSGKATPGDAPLKTLLGFTDDQIRVAREDEDIVQFVMRGAIRRLDFDDDYDIYVYSKSQAERLEAQLTASKVGAVVVVPEVSVGMMHASLSPGKSARPKPTTTISSATGKTVLSKSEAKLQKRHADASVAGRTPGQKGRPKKR